MTCQGCGSVRSQVFNGEVAIHFTGRDGLGRPIVWVFPKVAVCLNCGEARFTVPERELTVLVTGNAGNAAVVSFEGGRSATGVGGKQS